MDDEKLIQMIKSGETEALELLISKYYGDIYAYCFRRLDHKYDAQDITQDVFLHFCQNFDSYTHKNKCKNYLYVIAHNLCVNAIQKKKPITLANIEEKGLSDNSTAINRCETACSIEVALNKLTEEQKEIILLRFYHDFKLKDIAQIMNSGLSVTKYRLNQGLKKLSKLISKEDWI